MKRAILYTIAGLWLGLVVLLTAGNYFFKEHSGLYTIYEGAATIMATAYGMLIYSPGVRRFVKNIRIKILRNIPDPVREPTDRILIDLKATLFKRSRETWQAMRKDIARTVLGQDPDDPIPLTYRMYPDISAFSQGNGINASSLPYTFEEGLFSFIMVGDIGNGKTFALLNWMEKYSREQIERSPGKKPDFEKDRVLAYQSLASWDIDEDFENWMALRLSEKFNMIPGDALQLVRNNHVMPCLDGLDEVKDERRHTCLRTVLDYAKGNNVVLTCRTDEFRDCIIDDLQHIKYVPVYQMNLLEFDQVVNYLRKHQEADSPLSIALRDSPEMLHAMDTPLLLNLFTRAPDTLEAEEKQRFLDAGPQERTLILWRRYEDLIVKDLQISWPAIKKYLVSLSHKLGSKPFFVDQLDANWLPTRWSKFFYYLLSRVLSGILLAFAIGCIIAGPLDFIDNGILAGILVSLLTLWLFKIEKRRPIHAFWPLSLFSMVLAMGCGGYQSLAVPRQGGYLLSLSEAYPGIIFGLISGVIFGYRKTRQSAFQDILPVERLAFNWNKARRAGIRGSLFIGTLIGCVGVLIRTYSSKGNFNIWLSNFLRPYYDWLDHTFHHVNENIVESFALFTFAFLLAGISSFLVFALMAGRDRDTLDPENKKALRLSLNFGIRKSERFSLLAGLAVFILISVVYGVIMAVATRGGMSRWIKAVSIGFGMGVISSLLFGGFEVVQHRVLRLFLYFFDLVPWQLHRWVHKVRDLGFIQREGASLRFRHETLTVYFKEGNASTSLDPAPQFYRSFLGIIFAILLLFLVRPFANRFLLHHFWERPSMIAYSPLKTSWIGRLEDNSFIIRKKGSLSVSIKGIIKVGTFTGYSKPEGTDIGFLGFPLDSTYSIVKDHVHAAVLYHLASWPGSGSWRPLPYINRSFLPWGTRYACVPVSRPDTLQLMINDAEWQNNIGHFTITLNMEDSCRQQP